MKISGLFPKTLRGYGLKIKLVAQESADDGGEDDAAATHSGSFGGVSLADVVDVTVDK